MVVKVEAEDQSADFSREPPSSAVEAVRPIEADLAYWGQKVERYSAPFAQHGVFYQAQASISANTETRWFVNSEGSQVQTLRDRVQTRYCRQHEGGRRHGSAALQDILRLHPDGLPDDETVRRDVEKMIATLLALREAPLVEPYTGPAISPGGPAGCSSTKSWGIAWRVTGKRARTKARRSRTARRAGVPENFRSISIPRPRIARGTDLAGAYRFDNQGIEARRVPVIVGGVLKNFLMSRAPIERFFHSNGHGRKQGGFAPSPDSPTSLWK